MMSIRLDEPGNGEDALSLRHKFVPIGGRAKGRYE